MIPLEEMLSAWFGWKKFRKKEEEEEAREENEEKETRKEVRDDGSKLDCPYPK